MYGWLWRHIPGNTWVKGSTVIVLAFGLIAVLFLWVFPWLAPLLPFQQQTVGE